jgi:hypothetical protein
MKLMPLNHQINIRAQYQSQVFRDFNPPTMDDDEYMRVLEKQGFFANSKGGGYVVCFSSVFHSSSVSLLHFLSFTFDQKYFDCISVTTHSLKKSTLRMKMHTIKTRSKSAAGTTGKTTIRKVLVTLCASNCFQ